jgi:addiction module HigA family antidote
MKTAKMLSPIPPGEILMEEFMRPLGISINALARALAVPANRISGIINGTRAITADRRQLLLPVGDNYSCRS